MNPKLKIWVSSALLPVVVIGMISTLTIMTFAAANQRAEAALVPDEKGVMMYNYGGGIGVVYNPKVVALEGLKYHERYESTGDLQARQYFINTADWLVQHAADKGMYSVWEYGFVWPWYGGILPPYCSALAQAEGISVLIRAHNMTGSEHYLTAARKAFRAFLVNYEKGGVASDEGNDSVFLQLLAKPGFKKTYVLNGHTRSLILLWKYFEYTHDYRSAIIFGKGVSWLTNNLQKYDTGSWSYYDQVGTIASDSYHRAHIKQLAELYKITGEPIFREYSERFAGYAGVGASGNA